MKRLALIAIAVCLVLPVLVLAAATSAVGGAVAVAVDPVAGPGGGQELHRAAGAGVVDGAFLPAGRVG